MKKMLLVGFLLLGFTVQAVAQGDANREQPQQENPAQETPVVDPIERQVQLLAKCNLRPNTEIQSWNLMVIGDSDDSSKVAFVDAIDRVAEFGSLLSGTQGIGVHKREEVVVRRTTIWFNHTYLNNLKKYAETKQDTELLEKIEKSMSLKVLLKDLLSIKGVTIQCPGALERSRMSSPALRGGVTGSN